MKKTNKITAGTITRTVFLALALINQILVSTGHSILPIDNELLEQVITVGFTSITSIIAFWKNNSFTESAIQGDATKVKVKQINKLNKKIK